jgi:hypothetical protein
VPENIKSVKVNRGKSLNGRGNCRGNAFTLTGSFALGSAGFAVIGPIAAVTGARTMLGFAAAWGLASSVVVLALPAIRSVTWLGGTLARDDSGTGDWTDRPARR